MIIPLTSKNVSIIKNKAIVVHPALQGLTGMLAVTAQWCRYCQDLKPVYNKVSSMVGTAFPMFNLDVDTNSDAVEKLGVRSFPTLFFIQGNGSLKPYSGTRTVDSFLNEICKEANKCMR